jgi:hypothetical protein
MGRSGEDRKKGRMGEGRRGRSREEGTRKGERRDTLRGYETFLQQDCNEIQS